MQIGKLSISDYNKNKPRRLQWDFVGFCGVCWGSSRVQMRRVPKTHHYWPIQTPERHIGDQQGAD
jgi:hypothetical protein